MHYEPNHIQSGLTSPFLETGQFSSHTCHTGKKDKITADNMDIRTVS